MSSIFNYNLVLFLGKENEDIVTKDTVHRDLQLHVLQVQNVVTARQIERIAENRLIMTMTGIVTETGTEIGEMIDPVDQILVEDTGIQVLDQAGVKFFHRINKQNIII